MARIPYLFSFFLSFRFSHSPTPPPLLSFILHFLHSAKLPPTPTPSPLPLPHLSPSTLSSPVPSPYSPSHFIFLPSFSPFPLTTFFSLSSVFFLQLTSPPLLSLSYLYLPHFPPFPPLPAFFIQPSSMEMIKEMKVMTWKTFFFLYPHQRGEKSRDLNGKFCGWKMRTTFLLLLSIYLFIYLSSFRMKEVDT